MVRINTAARIRDSLYGDIAISETELEIIKSEAFQRLRWISQLGAVQLIYPGATHTRYSHSIGVLHNATKFANDLDLDINDTEYLRYAALLHDICELPFERLFQEYFNIPELEKNKLEIIKKVCDGVGITFSIIKEIISPIEKNNEYYYLNRILLSDFGADRTDFLVRDSILSGVKYGLIDDRVFHIFYIAPDLETEKKTLYIRSKELSVIEAMLGSFYQIKNPVYDHVMVRSALSLLRGAIEKSMEKRKRNSPLYLVKNRSDKPLFVFKTDYEFLFELSKDCPQDVHNYMSNQLPQPILNINYYNLKDDFKHPIILRFFEKYKEMEGRKEIEEELSVKLGDKKHKTYFDVVSVQPIDKENQLEIIYPNGKITPLLKGSRSLSQWNSNFDEQWKVYIYKSCKDKQEKDKYSMKLGEYFNFLTKETDYKVPIDGTMKLFEKLYELTDDFGKTTREEIVYIDPSIRDKIDKLSNERKEILKHIYKLKKASANEISKLTGTKRVTASILLGKLRNEALLSKHNEGRWVFYHLTPNVKAVIEKIYFDTIT